MASLAFHSIIKCGRKPFCSVSFFKNITSTCDLVYYTHLIPIENRLEHFKLAKKTNLSVRNRYQKDVGDHLKNSALVQFLSKLRGTISTFIHY